MCARSCRSVCGALRQAGTAMVAKNRTCRTSWYRTRAWSRPGIGAAAKRRQAAALQGTLPVDLNYGGGKLKDLSLDSTQILMTRVFWLCAGSEFSLGNGEKGL